MTARIPFDHDLVWEVYEHAGGMVARRLQAVAAADELSPPELILQGRPPAGPGAWDGAQVLVSDRHGSGPVPLLHVVSHSPTGMAWGYAGSGPADLALSILHLVLVRAFSSRLEAHPSVIANVAGMPLTDDLARGALSTAAVLHQDFKFAVVAGLPVDAEWLLEERSVLGWLLEHLPAAEG